MKLKKDDYVFEVFDTTVGKKKYLRQIKEVYVNTVLFTNGSTGQKSMLIEVDEWIDIAEHEPDCEVLAIGYQEEQLIGYIGGEDGEFSCEGEGVLLEDVTHWRPKPFEPSRFK